MRTFRQRLFQDPDFVEQIELEIRRRLIGRVVDADFRAKGGDPPATIMDATITDLVFTPGDSPDDDIAVSGRAEVTVQCPDASGEGEELDIVIDGDVTATISVKLPDHVTDDSDVEESLDELTVDWGADDVAFSPDDDLDDPDDYDEDEDEDERD